MCGIATKTNHLSKLIKKINRKSKLFATRKTAPGLRYFDKIAVETGGGNKHRMTLDDMIMFKDNHLAIEKSIFSLSRRQRNPATELKLKLKVKRMQF